MLPLNAFIGFVFLIAGLLILFLGLRWITRDELQPRLRDFVADQDEQTRQWTRVVSARTQELSGSITNRVLLPFIRRTGEFFGRLTPVSSVDRLQRQLYIAGNPLGLGPREFYGIRLAFLFIGLWLSFMLLRREASSTYLLVVILVIAICIIFPVLWIRMMVASGKKRMRKGLPDSLDMLSVCADAGLGFDQSLQRVSEHWKTPIALEFGRVVTEMEMGLSRQEALHNLADRLDITEISSFVAIILQSDKLGMSIAETLHVQAEQMRVERRFRAQEQARIIPIKMLIPLAFLIFPALMAILLGPALPPLINLFTNF